MSDFSDLHDDLRDVARDVLGKEVSTGARWRQAADAGWLGLEVPEAHGGSGATFAETAVVLGELGRAAADVAFLGPAVLGVAAALAADGGDERDRLLARMADGTTKVAVALAPHADSAVAHAAFRLDAGGRLHGRAELVVDADRADHLLLLADAPAGPALVHVLTADVATTPEPVLDASRSFATVEADGVAVSNASVWPTDPESVQRVLDRAAVAVAADAHGVASAMLDATVAYVGVRRQFDRPIGSFQAVKHQCADALVHLRIGTELLEAAIDAVCDGRDDAGPAVAGAASFVGDIAVDVVGMAMQLHGGIGYTWESGIHRSLKRALLDRSLFGSPAEHRRRLAGLRWP